MLMQSLINLDLVTSRKGIFVLFVTVPVNRAPFAFGGFISSIFPGTPVFSPWHPLLPVRKLIILRSLRPVLLIFVILVKESLVPSWSQSWVPSAFTFTVAFILLLSVSSPTVKVKVFSSTLEESISFNSFVGARPLGVRANGIWHRRSSRASLRAGLVRLAEQCR